ncbi:hypothetical protein KQX54_007471 [Cotesia glomerata]|uniref:Uncharacterized protein n=1 Tax=Cotesia glomerata TaxID=32391 RepID=A0AAV7IC35_COTGL|nr:hypothetical protein KQX54_007471 [Cotesia glomerata]
MSVIDVFEHYLKISIHMRCYSQVEKDKHLGNLRKYLSKSIAKIKGNAKKSQNINKNDKKKESGSEVLLRKDNSKDAKNSEEESEPETDDPNKLYEKAEFENEEADIENRRAAVRDGATDDEDDEDGIEEGALIIDEDKVYSSAGNDSDVEREIDDESATE